MKALSKHWIFISICSFSVLALILWLYLDQHVPASDEAGHILDSFRMTEIIHKPHLLNLNWWHKLLTVNQYYPPFADYISALIRLFVSAPKGTTYISQAIWLVVLNLSTYVLANKLLANRMAAIFSVFYINLFPLVNGLSHFACLDLPVQAMVICALAALSFLSTSTSTKSSLICGGILGLAVLTKQVAIGFIAVPVLYALYLRKSLAPNTNSFLKQTGILIVVGLLICLPWFMTNISIISNLNEGFSADLAGRGSYSFRVLFNSFYYIFSPWFILSPFLSLLFAFSIFVSGKEIHQKLTLLWLSFLPGFIGLSLLSCQPARDRYLCTLIALAAIYLGNWSATLWTSGNKIKRSVVLAAGIIACIQFVSLNFCPQPISSPSALVEASPILQIKMREHVSPCFSLDSIRYWPRQNPDCNNQNIAKWVMAQLSKHVYQNPGQYFNVTMVGPEVDVHQFELLVKEESLPVTPTTLRSWTHIGDLLEFSPKTALYFKWYLIKDGDQGFRFHDQGCKEAQKQLIAFVKTSGNYQLIASKHSQDGSMYYLYEKK